MRSKRRRPEDSHNTRRRKRHRRGPRTEYQQSSRNDNRPHRNNGLMETDAQRSNQLRPPHDVLLLNFYVQDAQIRSPESLTSIFGPFGTIIQFVEVEPLTPNFVRPSIVIDFQKPSRIQNTIDALQQPFINQVRMEIRGAETRFQTLQILHPPPAPLPAPLASIKHDMSAPANLVSMQPIRARQRPPIVQTTPILPESPQFKTPAPILPEPPQFKTPAPTDPRRPTATRPNTSKKPVTVAYRRISMEDTNTMSIKDRSKAPISANPAPNKAYSYDPNRKTYYSYPDVRNADLSVEPMDLDSTTSTSNNEESLEPTKHEGKEKQQKASSEDKDSEDPKTLQFQRKLKKKIVHLGRQYTDAAFKSKKINKDEAKEIIKKLSDKVAKHIMGRSKWQKRMKVLLAKEGESIQKLAKGYIGAYRKRRKNKTKS